MVDAKMVRDIATKYIYDRCPAVVGVGKEIFVLFYNFRQNFFGHLHKTDTFQINHGSN